MLDTQGLEGKGYQPVTVPTKAKKVQGIWSLHVTECPFCGREHWHGGGSGARPSAGPRVAHCGAQRGMYVLVPVGGAA
jgi:hypothetical protein